MALTKAHEAIRIAKEAIRDQIEAANKAGKEAIKRVPDFVLQGKHGPAVAWKELASEFVDLENMRGPYRATTNELKERLLHINIKVEMLCGRKPLIQQKVDGPTRIPSEPTGTQQESLSAP
jgi:hypothetical protein